jgi:hypothetical protein
MAVICQLCMNGKHPGNPHMVSRDRYALCDCKVCGKVARTTREKQKGK